MLAGAGLVGLAVGQALDHRDICPIVKRIWTPGWAIVSTGWTCLALAAAYGMIDLGKNRWWTIPVRWCVLPLIVVGSNSSAMYFMAQLTTVWTRNTLRIHLGAEYVDVFGSAYASIVEASCTVLVLWLVCFCLYRQKVFLRV